MGLLNNFVIAIVAEILFLVLVVIVVWLVITRRQLLRQQALRVHRDNELNTLRQRLRQSHQILQVANEKIKQLESAQQPQDDRLLVNYQQRIANLEKFKTLYFDLEARLTEVEGAEENNTDTVEMHRYKQRAQELEVIELRLQNELVKHQRRIKELEKQASGNAVYGAMQVKEVEDITQRLQQRENEIRRLRQECETIGCQYEELATKSLAIAGEGSDLSHDQKIQLEELKRKLEENTVALARKKAECELLENSYLALEESTELAKTAKKMQESNAERDVLQAQQHDLGALVEGAVNFETAQELVKLRQSLLDKEADLNAMRDEYAQIKEQFVEVAQAENELRTSNQALKQECEKLRREIRELNEAREESGNQQTELEKLRAEYNKMESRYLALVEKHR